MKDRKKSALAFIMLIGILSLFSDMTHEGARSILGPYLSLLGASAATIGFVSGLGEFIGYAFRLITGFISDKTKKYWTMTIIGYAFNLVAIPLLAFVPENGWKYACGLVIIERFGKAIRYPAKNTLTSFAAKEVGVGKGFAIQEALDQIGAFLGPLMLFIILTIRNKSNLYNNYVICFLALGIPAVITFGILLACRYLYPNPQEFDTSEIDNKKLSLNKAYRFYIIAIALVAAGFADFPLIGYHIAKNSIFDENFIPILYSLAMGVDAFSALFFGALYDKKGINAIIIASLISLFFAPFVFLSNSPILIIIGISLWGIGMGAQESILKSAIATIITKDKRAMAYGVFNTGFGVFWFLGSWFMGILYDKSIMILIIFSMVMQFSSIPFFMMTKKKLILTEAHKKK
jgi:MFS family permease